jgi:hypothetical protein
MSRAFADWTASKTVAANNSPLPPGFRAKTFPNNEAFVRLLQFITEDEAVAHGFLIMPQYSHNPTARSTQVNSGLPLCTCDMHHGLMEYSVCR